MLASAPFEGFEVAAVVRPFGVGVDCHSKFIAVCVLSLVRGEVRRYERDFPTSVSGLEAARLWSLQVLTDCGNWDGEFRYVIESTGCYHFPVVHAFGGTPSIVNPMLAGAYRRKTDKLDARTLAYHGMTGLWPASFFPTGEIIEFRVLALQRRQRLRERGRFTSQINNVLLRWGHTIGATGSVLSGTVRPVIEDLCRGIKIPPHPWISPLAIPPLVREVILRAYKAIDAISTDIQAVEKCMIGRCREMEWDCGGEKRSGVEVLKLLTSVPGVGPITALTWLSEIVTPERFLGVKQLHAYIGCDPSLKVSAGKVTAHTRRKGNVIVHYAMIQAAQMLIGSRREAFGQWGFGIASKHAKGGWQKAVGAVARKIGGALYWVQKKGVPFSYEGYNMTLNRENVGILPVEELPFSARVIRLLQAYNVTDSRDLVDHVEAGLLKKRGFGKVARKELTEWLDQQRLKQPKRKSTTVAACVSPEKSSPVRIATTPKPMRPFDAASPIVSLPASTSSSSTSGGAKPNVRWL